MSDRLKVYEFLLQKSGLGMPGAKWIPKSPESDAYPTSFAQQRLWFMHKLDPNGVSFNIPLAVKLVGRVDHNVLKFSIGNVIHRHEILRTVFIEKQGIPYQVVQDDYEFEFITNNAGDRYISEEELNQILKREAEKPFCLEEGPLLRVMLYCINDEESILLITMHHIVMDGWSLRILIDELVAHYNSGLNGGLPDMPELTIQYRDYAFWQHEDEAQRQDIADLAFWKTYLDGMPPMLELPFDFKRPQTQSSMGSTVPFKLGEALAIRIEEIAKANACTVFIVLVAVYNLLLHKMTMQKDIVIGIPMAGREQKQLEQLIGFFVNTVALRSKIDQRLTFFEYLEIVKENALEVYAHQGLPFEKLVAELNIDRSVQHAPIFQTMFSFQNTPASDYVLTGVSMQPMQVDLGYSQYDLSVTVWKSGSVYEGTFEYSKDLFIRQSAEKIAFLYHNLLSAVVHSGHIPMMQFGLLTSGEQKMMLAGLNEHCVTGSVYGSGMVGRFRNQVRAQPHAVALYYLDQTISYQELECKAGMLAGKLVDCGVGPDAIVPICANASIELIVGLLGVLMAGGICAPIDPAYPQERIRHILKDTKASVMLVQEQLMQNFVTIDSYGAQVLSLGIDSLNGRYVCKESRPEGLAFIIYTSGTEGVPKGVMLKNEGIDNLIQSFIDSYHPKPDDRLMPLTSVASASFIGEAFPILAGGGALVLPDKQVFAYDGLMRAINENSVTIISTVPSFIAKMNKRGMGAGILRLILCGGERLLPSQVDNLIKTVTIVNGYGLTEASVCSTYYILDENNLDAHEVVPIGKPIANTDVLLLDEGLNLVPEGCCGEIYISGAGLAQGYFNAPELTAARFIPNPFSSGSVIFRSGDMAVRLADGNLRYIGRMDKQIKIRGYRIETEEIENKINAMDGVQDCCVVLCDSGDGRGEEKLLAYVVPVPGHEPSLQGIRKRLVKFFPAYMIPSGFAFIDYIPLTTNYKVDISKLPKQEQQNENITGSVPRNRLEAEICEVWKEALGLDSVSINENFFDLGGHSLMLMQVYERLRELRISEKEFMVIDLFKYPTVELIAEFIRGSGQDETYQAVGNRMEKRRMALSRSWSSENRL